MGFDGTEEGDGDDRADDPWQPAVGRLTVGTGIGTFGAATQPFRTALGTANAVLAFLILTFGGHGSRALAYFDFSKGLYLLCLEVTQQQMGRGIRTAEVLGVFLMEVREGGL